MRIGRTRVPLAVLAAALTFAAVSAGDAGAISFRPCIPGSTARCAKLKVPLDRTGAVPGSVSLQIIRGRAKKPDGGAVFAFAGGPGQGATPLFESFARDLEPALRRDDLVVFDQRGTGDSGPLDCRAVDRVPEPTNTDAQVRRCAKRMGARARFYTTRDTVEDIEAVRRALGYKRISLYGVSYGTKVALLYAAAHPDRVDRLALDSIVEPEGPDPLLRGSFASLPRVLRELCAGSRCSGITSDPADDLAALVSAMRVRPVRGVAYTRRGTRRTVTVDSVHLYRYFLIGDTFEPLRAALPSAIRSANAGDVAPLVRLADRVSPPARPDPPPLPEFSTGLWLATACEELPFPWDATAPEAMRRTEAASRIAGLGPAPFAPFDGPTALDSDLVHMCEHWPIAERGGPVDLSAIRAPTLLISGLDDVRTPVENANRVAARLASARVLPVGGVGHSVVGSDFSGCARSGLDRFLTSRSVPASCPRRRARPALVPVAPTSAAKLKRLGPGGRPGRTARAVELTIRDLFWDATTFNTNAGGLRGGRYKIGFSGIKLDRLVYAPGVSLSGTYDPFARSGELRISGSAAADGRLSIKRTVATGTLGGRRVRVTMSLPKLPTGIGDGGGGSGEPRVPTWAPQARWSGRP